MSRRNGRLAFSEKDRGRIWKEDIEKIINEENEWDQETYADVVEGRIKSVTREEILYAR